MLRLSLLLLPVAAAWTACGARSSLQDDGVGGAPGNAGSTVASVLTDAVVTSTGTGFDPPPSCSTLRLDGDPVRFVDPVPGPTHDPDLVITARDETMFTWMWFNTPMGDPTLDPDALWPDPIDARNGIESDTESYALGHAPDGPVLLVRDTNGAYRLTYGLFELGVAPIGIPLAGDPLFVVGSGDRFLYAAGDEVFGSLLIGDHQIGNLPQSPTREKCLTTRLMAAAVATDDGFLAAYTSAGLDDGSCDFSIPRPATHIEVVRHRPAAPQLGAELLAIPGERLVAGEPFAALGLARAGSGAWLVTKTDGSTSEIQPPYSARRLDENGVGILGSDVQLSDPGIPAANLAVATLGDALAIAYVDDGVVARTRIVVRRMDPATTTLTSLDIPTDVASSGRLRLIATPSARSLVLVWEDTPRTSVWLAKVDCVD